MQKWPFHPGEVVRISQFAQFRTQQTTSETLQEKFIDKPFLFSFMSEFERNFTF
jgi:hypothetical protein